MSMTAGNDNADPVNRALLDVHTHQAMLDPSSTTIDKESHNKNELSSNLPGAKAEDHKDLITESRHLCQTPSIESPVADVVGTLRRSASVSGRSVAEPTLDNPFQLFETVQVLDDAVERLALRHNLRENAAILKRAARAVRDAMEAFDEPDFPSEERIALEKEIEATFWQQSRELRSAVLVVGGLSGICQGFTQSILNATGPALERDFNLRIRTDDPQRSNLDLFTYGALAAAVPLAAGILSPFLADPIQNHWLGRRGAVAVSALISVAATVGAACSETIPQLIGCRIVIGASLGAKASIIAPFLAELAPVHIRGAILSVWQISDAFGIFAGFIAWRIIENFTLSSQTRWRLLSGTTLLPTIPLVIAAYMVPESYIFLMKTRKYTQAAEAACLYRRKLIQGFRDLIASHFQMEAEEELKTMRKDAKKAALQARSPDVENPLSNRNATAGNEIRPLSERLTNVPPGICLPLDTNRDEQGDGDMRDSSCPHRYHMKEIHFYKRLWQVVEDARCRRALLSCGMAMLAQSLCGINAFAFFSSSLLDAGIGTADSLSVAIAFGGVNFGFGLITPFLSDRLGRTTLILIGLPIMTVLMFILAAVFEVGSSARTPTIIVFYLLFTAIYSFTLGPAAFSLSAESFPSSVREAGMAICVLINMTSLGVLLLIYPFVTAPIGYTASLCIFGCIDLLAFVGCFLFCVDTKDRTLDELQFSFDLPSSLHCKYRLYYVLPEAWDHYVGVVRRLFSRKRDSANRDAGSCDSSSSSGWSLIPFHRWARIEDASQHSLRSSFPKLSRLTRIWAKRGKGEP